jgi:hypothetical protein
MPVTLNYTVINGDAAPEVLSVQSLDARTVEVIFSKAMVESEALDPDNYSFDPALSVESVEKVTDKSYRLTTSKQVPLGAYTATITGIHDLDGNSI